MEKFDVAELTYGMIHTDRRFQGVDILQVGVRKWISTTIPANRI